MGFVKDVVKGAAKIGAFGIPGVLLSGGKKKQPPPSMVAQGPTWQQGTSQPTRPTSMIGGTKWGS